MVAVQEKSSRVWKAPPPQLKLLYTSTYLVPITRPEYGIWVTSRIQYLPHEWTNEEGCLCPVRTLLKLAPDAMIELIHCKWAKSKCQKLYVFMQKGWPCVYRAITSCQCGLDAHDCDNVECIAVFWWGGRGGHLSYYDLFDDISFYPR